MKHFDCKNYINLDCEKGICALCKAVAPIDGEGSEACTNFRPAEKCGICVHFSEPDKYGIGTCRGLGKPNWAYAVMNSVTCAGYRAE